VLVLQSGCADALDARRHVVRVFPALLRCHRDHLDLIRQRRRPGLGGAFIVVRRLPPRRIGKNRGCCGKGLTESCCWPKGHA
jgi:hypothetical protein